MPCASFSMLDGPDRLDLQWSYGVNERPTDINLTKRKKKVISVLILFEIFPSVHETYLKTY